MELGVASVGMVGTMIVFSFVGDSGVGKTTLLVSLVSILRASGLDVRAVKHSKGFDDPEPPSKDSRRIREAGASRVVLASPCQTVLIWDHAESEPPFAERLALVGNADLVLVESFAASGLPVVEVLRSALPRRTPRMSADDSRWIALVSDFDVEGVPPRVRRFGFEQTDELARFLASGLSTHDTRKSP